MVENRSKQTTQVKNNLKYTDLPGTNRDFEEAASVSAAEPPPGFWQRDNHVPEPLMPMYRSICHDGFNAAMKQLCDDFGALIDTIERREISGWEYMRSVPLGGREGPTPPTWLLAIMARLHPLMRSRIKKCIGAIRSDMAGQIIRSWYKEWKPAQIARITELRAVELKSLTDTSLDEHIGVLLSFFSESTNYHHRLMAVGIPLANLVFICRDVLGWNDVEVIELLSGLSEKSAEPSRRLTELARLAAKKPAVLAFLEKRDHSNVASLAKIDVEFNAAFEAYQYEFGCRGLQYTFHEPTLAERPALVLSLIRDQIKRSLDLTATTATIEEKRKAALERARAALAKCPVRKKERFERALVEAELAYPVREDNVFYTHNVPFGLVRYGLLEMGNRLVGRGQIADRDDVFFLEIAEARDTFRKGNDQRALIASRKADFAWAKAHPGPATYGKDPEPYPSFAGFPAEVQFAMNALIWYTERVFAGNIAGEEQPIENSRINGMAASAGRYTGPARIVMNESEFGKIQAGDVLVCPVTSPTWSIIFPNIGALVTDTGGVLSHPAIIAREYGIPAVVATGNATGRLRDSQSITVDGGAGVVEISVL